MTNETERKQKEQSIFHHTGFTIQTNDKTVKIITKIEEPLILVLDHVLSDDECRNLIELSKNRLNRSKIGEKKEVNAMRTSSGMFFQNSENDFISTIEKRIAEVMCIPVDYAEGLHILNYQPHQEYKPHVDFFKEGSKSADNNRISTLVIYLNDVEEGGETTFPSLNFSVTPKKGRAVYFEYFYNNFSLNELTLHSGAPIIKGEKWVATQWMRRKKIR